MLVPLSHSDWQVLRAIHRAGRKAPLGRNLRLTPSQKTKDGTFLDGLAAAGLIAAVGEPEAGDAPLPFRTRYALTDLGRHAAEYGEYDQLFVLQEAPLVGAAAAIVAARDGKKAKPVAPPAPRRKGRTI